MLRSSVVSALVLAVSLVSGSASARCRPHDVARATHASHVSRVARAAPRRPVAPAPRDVVSSAERYNLDRINEYRRSAGLPLLALDPTLSAFARDGSEELMRDHVAHGHFRNAGDSLWRRGFSGNAAENQGAPGGWPRAAGDPGQNVRRQIDQILASMMSEGPGGGHHDNLLSPKAKRLGVGLVTDGEGKLYLTNDFSE